MMANNTTTTTLSQANCRKVFVQRDFSEGTGVRFGTRFPAELEGKIDKQLYDYTINTLNSLYEEAEKGSCSTYCEGGYYCFFKRLMSENVIVMFLGCMACLTAYIIYFCAETHYEKCLKKVSRFIHEQNEQVWTKRGLLITDPVERGLRVIEISLLTEAGPGPSNPGQTA